MSSFLSSGVPQDVIVGEEDIPKFPETLGFESAHA